MVFKAALRVGMVALGLAAPGADHGSLKARFERTQVPRLLIFCGPTPTSEARAVARAAADLDEFLDRGVEVLVVKEGPGEASDEASWLRERAGLGPEGDGSTRWVLLDSKGRVLESAPGLPPVEGLVPKLLLAGERSRVEELRAFLRQHPDHAEAQRDLLVALRRRTLARVRQSAPPEGRDLDPEVDERVWGAFAQVADRLMSRGQWALFDLSLDGLLPATLPEKASPRMVTLYRKHRPSFLEAVRNLPGNTHLWLNLLRMELVLGRPLPLGDVGDVPILPQPGGSLGSLDHLSLGRAITKVARTSQDWRAAKPLLAQLWWRGARPHLHTSFVLGIGPEGRSPTDSERARIATEDRENLWQAVLGPLVEALVRTGEAGAVPGVLASLDASWAALGLGGKLEGLARHLGRPDLIRPWLTCLAGLPEGVPVEGMLGLEFRIFHEGQDPRLDLGSYPWTFLEAGVEMMMIPVPGPWRARLGWDGRTPKWALVDHEGNVRLAGDHLPQARALRGVFEQGAGETWAQRVETFLRKNPSHLSGLAAWARVQAGKARAFQERRRGEPPGSPEAERLAMGEMESWEAYLRALSHLLDQPLGSHPDLLERITPHGLRDLGAGGGGPEDAPPVAVPTASLHRVLTSLEGLLHQRPGDQAVWGIWLELEPWSTRRPSDLLADLTPSPGRSAEVWPPEPLLHRLARSEQGRGDWLGVVSLLEPRWRAWMERRREGPAGPAQGAGSRPPGWSGRLTQVLLEAELHLGRLIEAGQILDGLDEFGERLDDPRGALQLATTLGHEAWARARRRGPEP